MASQRCGIAALGRATYSREVSSPCGIYSKDVYYTWHSAVRVSETLCLWEAGCPIASRPAASTLRIVDTENTTTDGKYTSGGSRIRRFASVTVTVAITVAIIFTLVTVFSGVLPKARSEVQELVELPEAGVCLVGAIGTTLAPAAASL